ncbi:MAG: tetratricopeptide repeat protein [Bacteroidales bacterium]|nr:tetratricopeptide repeat protein [Bacteroidales bacterium]
MKKILSVLCCMLLASAMAFSQKVTFTEEENALIEKAFEQSDNGEEQKAIETYAELLKKYPESGFLMYETAYCYYKMEKWKIAHDILEEAEKSEDVTADMFAMDGNSLDNMGLSEFAVEKYKEGLRLFPDSGNLHVELGNVYTMKKDYQEALKWYLEGIEREPNYTSNYYRASVLLFSSSNPVLGVEYAEVHNLLSPSSARSEELSKYIAIVYRKHFAMGDNASVSDIAEKIKENLSAEDYNQQQYHVAGIRSFHIRVIEAGHWEAYNQWLMRGADPEAFSDWVEQNEEAFDSFAGWYNDNLFNLGTE